MMEPRAFRDIEALARRAPSAHNSQPWRLRHDGDALQLTFDPGCHLAAGDASRRDLLLSLGTFVEAFLVASTDHGEAVRFLPEINFDLCALGRFLPASKPYPTPFNGHDLEARRTSRLAYEPGFLDRGACAALGAHLDDGWRLHHLESPAISRLLERSVRHMFETPPLVAELHRWLRLGAASAQPNDGLSAPCLGLGRAQAMSLQALLSRPIHPLARRLGLARAAGHNARRLLDPPHSVLVLSGAVEHAGHVLSSGRMLMRLWLELSRHGRYVHPLSEIIDFPRTRLELATMIGCLPGENILAIFRAGRSPVPARSRRRGSNRQTAPAGQSIMAGDRMLESKSR